jgi:thioesterase domain-containing protein/acyl carrier protein
LFTGAAACLFDIKRRGTVEIVNWIGAEGITVFRAQQSTFRPVFADAPTGMIFETIRLLGIGGDVLSQQDVNLFRAHTPAHSVMASAFYSTECGGLLRNYIDHHTSLQGDTLPVGYPWPDKEVLLLDEQGNPVPRGERGQIVVRSANLCSGYWNQPALTAQKFHDDPADPRIKLYYSGDYGRLTEDGALEFLGREDSMVKIRGYRVEISEVETALKLHPAVKEAFVAAQPSRHRAGQKQLVGYIVPKESGLASWALREHLVAKLPDYMLPSFYVFLASIPVTSHGKVDKDALPPIPERAELTPDDLPADETERRLLAIWQNAFGQERIGVNDNFFELGGDSLLASAIFVEVERAFRRTYPLNILLKHGTIRRLARVITDPEAGDTTPIIALQPSGSRPPIFIFPGGVGDVLMLIGLAEALGEEQPVYGMQAAGFFGKTVYSRRVEEAAAHFAQEIKKVRASGPYHLAGHSFGGVIAFEVARQLREAGEAVGLVGLLDSHPPGSIHGGSFRRRMQTHLFNMSDLDWKGKIGYVTRHFQTRASKALGRFEFFQTLLRNTAVKQAMWDDPFRQTRFAAANYSPAQPYPGPVTLFIVSERPRHIDWDMMAPWHKFISGPIERVPVPGDHSSMIKPPHVTELARLMALSLEKVNS